MSFAARVQGNVRSAVDSSVLLDILLPDIKFGAASAALLRTAIDSGVIVACDIVWAEVRASFPNDELFEEAMTKLGISFDPSGKEAAKLAGSLWRRYRSAGKGGLREHLIPDFLVGAHALLQADALLSRDRGFYRRYFSQLKILDPSDRSRQ